MSCRIDHYFTYWLVEQTWMARAVAAYRDGLLTPGLQKDHVAKLTTDLRDPELWKDFVLAPHSLSFSQAGILTPTMRRDEDGSQIQGLEQGPNGMAILPIMGHMMKDSGSFGGCSTVACRRLIRQAVRSENVTGLMMYVDSPGGSAPGTAELAEEVSRARQSMPVHAHVEDCGASAAYWVASQAEQITANKMGEVGSIGTLAVLVDESARAEQQGVKVHVISTGAHKGAGVPGAPVTDDQLEAFQEQVHDVNAHFQDGVRAGRGFSDEQLEGVSDGRVFIASKALERGLIDGVSSFEDAVDNFATTLESRAQSVDRSRRLRIASTSSIVDGS